MSFLVGEGCVEQGEYLSDDDEDYLGFQTRLNIRVLDLVQPQDHMEEFTRTLNCDLDGYVDLAWPRIRTSPRDCLGHVSDFYFEFQLFDSSTVTHLPITMAVQSQRSSSDGGMDILSGKDAMSLIKIGLLRYLLQREGRCNSNMALPIQFTITAEGQSWASLSYRQLNI